MSRFWRLTLIALPIMVVGVVIDHIGEVFWATVIGGGIIYAMLPEERRDNRSIAFIGAQEPQMNALEQQRLASATEIRDADAVAALMDRGYTRKAAIAVLNATGWLGDTTEQRIANALRTEPPS